MEGKFLGVVRSSFRTIKASITAFDDRIEKSSFAQFCNDSTFSSVPIRNKR